MTKAEQMRTFAQTINQEKEAQEKRKHEQYIDSLINGAIHNQASAGLFGLNIAMESGYKPELVEQFLFKNGFEVEIEKSIQGSGCLLKIRW